MSDDEDDLFSYPGAQKIHEVVAKTNFENEVPKATPSNIDELDIKAHLLHHEQVSRRKRRTTESNDDEEDVSNNPKRKKRQRKNETSVLQLKEQLILSRQQEIEEKQKKKKKKGDTVTTIDDDIALLPPPPSVESLVVDDYEPTELDLLKVNGFQESMNLIRKSQEALKMIEQSQNSSIPTVDIDTPSSIPSEIPDSVSAEGSEEVPSAQKKKKDKGNKITVKVKFSEDETITVKTFTREPISKLRKGLSKSKQMEPSSFTIKFDGEELEDDQTFEDIGIEDGDCIDFSVKKKK